MASVDLSPVERQIVVDGVLDEMRDLSRFLAEAFEYEPIEAVEVESARWKIERLSECLGVLEKFEYVGPATGRGYAGTLLELVA